MPFHSSPGFLLVAALSVALVQGPLASHRERAAFQPPTVTSSPSIGLGALGRRARTCVSRNFLHMASPSAGVGGTWTCNDDLKPSTQGQKPLQASTWQWLTERTKGHTAQFDVIVRRSARRFEVQEQRSALLHKREVVSRLIADLDKNQEHLEIFRRQVRDIELNLAEALAASKHRIIEDAPTVSNKLKALEDGLLSARENLQGFEDAASAAREQAQILALDLRTTEAKVEELRIRTELEAERERQFVKLSSLLDDITDTENFPAMPPPAVLLGPGPGGVLPSIEGIPPSMYLETVSFAPQLWGGNPISELMRSPAEQPPVEQKQPEQAEADREASGRGQHGRVEPNGDVRERLMAVLPALSRDRAQRIVAALGENEAPNHPHLAGVVSFLMQELGLPPERAASVLISAPGLLLRPVPEMRAVTSMVKARIQEKDGYASRLVAAQPGVLLLEAEGDLNLRLDILLKNADLAPAKAAKVLTDCPRILAPDTAPATLAAVVEFLRDDVLLTFKDTSRVLAAFPQLLAMSVPDDLAPTVEWLKEIGVAPAKVPKVVRQHPKVFAYSLDNNLRPTVSYLWNEVGMDGEQLGRIVAAFPQVLGLSVPLKIRPLMTYLLDSVGVPQDKLPRMLTAFPQLLGLSLENNIVPHVHYLVEEVGIPRERLGKVLASFPHLLAYNLEDNLRPTVEYFSQHLNIPAERIGKLVATHPQILGYSVEDKLIPTVDYLVGELGVPKTQVALVVERCPKILGCSIDKNLRPTVEFLRKEVRIPLAEVGQIAVKYPSLLGLSIDNNLRPKLNYLTTELQIELDTISQQMVTCPQLLAYSLEKRIKPRHRLLTGKGLKLGLHSMLAPTDVTFYQRYGGEAYGEGLARMSANQASLLPSGSSSSGKYYWHANAKRASARGAGKQSRSLGNADAAKGGEAERGEGARGRAAGQARRLRPAAGRVGSVRESGTTTRKRVA